MRLVLAAAACLAAAPAFAASKLAPVPKDQAVVVHGPYEMGSCDACHERADAKDPGKAQVTRETCLACHDEFSGKSPVKLDKGRQHVMKGTCTDCHNPHSSKKRKLLL